MNQSASLSVAFVTIAVLSACAGSRLAAAPENAAPVRTLGSWTSAGLTKTDLLYVGNVDNEVTVYNYAKKTLVGVLTGFSQPMGECTDNGGNVYITDYAAQVIVEYAHGGSEPIKTLNDSPDHPYACSVDPTTGDLAVANVGGSSQGNVAIWSQGSGEPMLYTNSKIANFESCAYDSGGNLLANGFAAYPYQTYFAWLPHGGTKLANLFVPGPEPSWKWGGIYGVGWDGTFFTIDAGYIYRVAVTHDQAYYADEVQLEYYEQGENGPYAFYLKTPATPATAVVGGAYGDDGSSVIYWPYPAGYSETGEITHGTDRPYGVAISLAKH